MSGMFNKGWTFSRDILSDIRICGDVGDSEEEKVLGLSWDPQTDMLRFQTKLKFKLDSKCGLVDVCICSKEELDSNLHGIFLTRKVVLSNVMKVFEPIGLLSPHILQAKLLLRETWDVEALGWDDPLPEKRRMDWLRFLGSLLELNEIIVPRGLWQEGS